MKVVKKNVYYCDHCGKHGLSPILGLHEKHCTANPDRSCRLCKRESIREIIDKYKKCFYTRKKTTRHFLQEEQLQVVYLKKFTLDDIQAHLEENCPNCTLTIIRCLGLNRYYFKDKFKYDYKQTLEDWWEVENDYRAEQERYY